MASFYPQTDQVSKAIVSLKEFCSNEEAKQKQSSQLFSDNFLKLSLTLKKLPVNSQKNFIETVVPHCFLDNTATSICLITKDVDKRKKRDTEGSVNYFKSMLCESKKVSCIDEIISFKQLKIEYRTFETRRKLCSAYDVFLVDDRIANLVAPYLGRTFLEANKFPYAVKLTKGNLNNQIEKCLRTARMNFTQTSMRCCVRFGNLDQSTEDLLENFDFVVKSIDKKLPGSLANVRTMDINVANFPMLPVYVSTESANMVRLPVPKAKPNAQKPVTDVFDSFDNEKGTETKVRVWPTGHVQFIKSKVAGENSPKRTLKRKVRNLWTSVFKNTKKVKIPPKNQRRFSLRKNRKSGREKSMDVENLHEIKKELKQEKTDCQIAPKSEI